MTKELYPEIAKKFETTATRVERAIRHSIACSLDRGDYDIILKYFKSIPSNGNLANSQFVATIADYLKKKLTFIQKKSIDVKRYKLWKKGAEEGEKRQSNEN